MDIEKIKAEIANVHKSWRANVMMRREEPRFKHASNARLFVGQ